MFSPWTVNEQFFIPCDLHIPELFTLEDTAYKGVGGISNVFLFKASFNIFNLIYFRSLRYLNVYFDKITDIIHGHCTSLPI